jgi:putative phosphoesterase
LAWCAKEAVEKIICCGDIANGETLGVLAQEFKGEIFLIRGNMEIYGEEEVAAYKNYVYGGRTAVFEIAGWKVGVCHEPFFIKELLAKEKCEFVFYGHTHKPWVETKNEVQLVNPGTLGGVFTRATFAFWDTEKNKLELKILDLL